MTELKLDRMIRDFLDRYLPVLVLIGLIGAAAYIRIHLAPFTDFNHGQNDYNIYLKLWVDAYREAGVIGGLGQTIGNYYVPYNIVLALVSLLPGEPATGIAFFSCLADFGNAVMLIRILGLYDPDKKHRMKDAYLALLVLLLPFTVVNGALFKQCDAIFSFFLLCSLDQLIRRRYTPAIVFLSISFVFKQQAVFLLPFYVLYYLAAGGFSILSFLWIPLIYFIAGIPALACGRPFAETYGVYFGQIHDSQDMENSFPGIYNLGMENWNTFSRLAILYTLVVFAFAALLLTRYRKKLMREQIPGFAGWTIMTCCEFLPTMHDRYDYLAILLLVVYSVRFRRRLIPAAAVMVLVSLFTLGKMIYGLEPPMQVLSLFYLTAWTAVTLDLFGVQVMGLKHA